MLAAMVILREATTPDRHGHKTQWNWMYRPCATETVRQICYVHHDLNPLRPSLETPMVPWSLFHPCAIWPSFNETPLASLKSPSFPWAIGDLSSIAEASPTPNLLLCVEYAVFLFIVSHMCFSIFNMFFNVFLTLLGWLWCSPSVLVGGGCLPTTIATIATTILPLRPWGPYSSTLSTFLLRKQCLCLWFRLIYIYIRQLGSSWGKNDCSFQSFMKHSGTTGTSQIWK